jgi:hypothetical protein
MYVHSLSASGLHAPAETRGDEVGLTEVAPSALQTVTGGAAAAAAEAAGNPTREPILCHFPWCTTFVGLHHP